MNKDINDFSRSVSGVPLKQITCTVNGKKYSRNVETTETLLRFLHDVLGMNSVKEGCGEGECGACTVLMDGVTVNSCLVLAVEADDCEIMTVEGLSQNGELSILQEEFLHLDALQCGFCTPGMLMTARGLLNRNPNPSDEEIKLAISGNYCRCTGYLPVIDAIKSAAARERGEK